MASPMRRLVSQEVGDKGLKLWQELSSGSIPVGCGNVFLHKQLEPFLGRLAP